MEAVAKLNKYPTSPRKMRLVVDNIRGLDVEKALNVLRFTNKHCARPLEKLLLSAINNWESTNPDQRIDESELYIKQAFVDSGKIIRRIRPAPFGRAYRIRKRSNHVTIVIDSKKEIEQVEEPQNQEA